MISHLTKQQIQAYYARSLSPQELISALRHLTTCEACRIEAGASEKTRQTYLALDRVLEESPERDAFHLSTEHLGDYASNQIDEIDAEIVESHIEDCTRCAAEVYQLKIFATESTQPDMGAVK